MYLTKELCVERLRWLLVVEASKLLQLSSELHRSRRIGKRMQWNAVVKNPAVWILGMSSLCVYIARYAVESWGVVYLTSQKGYDMMGAAGVMLLWAAGKVES